MRFQREVRYVQLWIFLEGGDKILAVHNGAGYTVIGKVIFIVSLSVSVSNKK